MGPTRPRNSTRARKAGSAKSAPKPRRQPPRPKPTKLRKVDDAPHEARERLPADVEIAIHEERGSLIVAISILYGLHSILRRQLEEDDSEVSDAIEDAAEWADSTKLSEMLLVKLHEVMENLDNIASGVTNVDPEDVAIVETVREQSQSQGGAT